MRLVISAIMSIFDTRKAGHGFNRKLTLFSTSTVRHNEKDSYFPLRVYKLNYGFLLLRF